MDVERLLVCKIVQERDLASVTDAAIRPEFFRDDRSRQVFETLLRHRAEYGQVPGPSVVRSDFPDYKLVQVRESFPYLIDRLRKQHSLALIEEGLREGVEAYDDGDPTGAAAALSRTLSRLSGDVPSTRDVDVTRTGEERLARYLQLRDLPDGMRGVPTGFETLDRATQGLQNEQLVTLVGPPKAGKSTLLLLSSIAAHLYGKRPLVLTFEMSNEEMSERMDAIRSGISHARLRNGTLTADEWAKLKKYLHTLEGMPQFWFSADTSSATTLSGIAAKIDSLEPDILFVDGVYMMDDENGEAKGSPQALTNLTRGFKRMAQSKSIPIVISTQVLTWKMSKKRGVTADAIGYSSSFAQDSDVILSVEPTDEPDTNRLRIVAARNCPPLSKKVTWDWETGTFEEIESDEDGVEDADW